MQSTGSNHNEAATPPLVYLQRIDEALEHRNEIIEQLKSMRLAPESLGFRSEIDAFIAALQGDSDAKQFIMEGGLATWMPFRRSLSTNSYRFLAREWIDAGRSTVHRRTIE